MFLVTNDYSLPITAIRVWIFFLMGMDQQNHFLGLNLLAVNGMHFIESSALPTPIRLFMPHNEVHQTPHRHCYGIFGMDIQSRNPSKRVNYFYSKDEESRSPQNEYSKFNELPRVFIIHRSNSVACASSSCSENLNQSLVQ